MALLRDLRLPLVLTGDELIRSRAPDPMRVAHSAPDLVDIRGRDALRPPLLVGVAIVVCVALALIAIPETHTVPRLEGWSILALIGIGLAYFGWPRRRAIRARRGAASIDVDGVAVDLADARLRLTATHREWAPGPSEYGVVLEPSAGPHVVLISGSEPDRVLADLALLRRIVPLTVSAGWNLPKDSPWTGALDRLDARPSASDSSYERPRAEAPSSNRGRTKRSIAGTVLVGSAGVCAIVVMNVWHRIAVGDSPAALSLVLPVVSLAIVVAIGLGIGSSRTTLELDSELHVARRMYGVRIGERSIDKGRLRNGFLVSPDGRTPRHVLFETDEGAVAFRCDPEVGQRLLDQLYGGGPSTSSAPPAQLRR